MSQEDVVVSGLKETNTMSKAVSAGDAILEQVVQVAIAAGREAARQADDPRHAGRALAYYDVLDVIWQQMQVLGYRFEQSALNAFDPDGLLAAMSCNQRPHDGQKANEHGA